MVFADADAQTWTIGNNSIRVMFRLTAANDLVLDRIFEPTTGRVFNSSTGPDSAVTINGVSAPLGVSTAGWTLVDAAMSETTAGVRLTFTFRSSRAALTVVRTYACYPDSPTVEAWTTFRATGNASVSVSDVSVWQLVIPAATVHYVLGLRNDNPGSPVEDAFTVQSAVLGQGEQLLLREADRSAETYLPMIAADTRSDEFFGGLLWSGSWQIAAQGLGGTIRATATLPGTTFTVDATRPIETPHGFFGFTPGGRGDVSEALRTFIARGVRDGREYLPLVTYNTWFAVRDRNRRADHPRRDDRRGQPGRRVVRRRCRVVSRRGRRQRLRLGAWHVGSRSRPFSQRPGRTASRGP